MSLNRWLAEFPSTNGRIAVTIALIGGTGVTVLVTRFLEHVWSAPPTTWLGFLLVSAGLDTTHFYLKRRTTFPPAAVPAPPMPTVPVAGVSP